MMRLFSPRKTTLLFVIRDKTKTPLEHLEPVLREDIQKIWDAVAKPEAHKNTALSEFFNVEVTALPSYEEKEEQFNEQVEHLRQQFIQSIAPGGLAGDRRGVVPASGFSFSAQEIWRVIRDNKDLDLPAHKVMVATVRCEEIANEKLNLLTSDERWLELEMAVQSGPVSGFGKLLGSILDTYLSQYDSEAAYFDETVRTAKRLQLETRALQLVHPAFQAMLGHMRARSLDKFKTDLETSLKKGKGFAEAASTCTETAMVDFDEQCIDIVIKQTNWDTSKVRDKLRRDIEEYSMSIRTEKLSELTASYEKQLTETLSEPVESLFDAASVDTWASIRKIYRQEVARAISTFTTALSGFELVDAQSETMISNLKDYATSIIEKKSREEAGKVLMHMKDRFSTVFNHDKDSMPRVWTGKENVRIVTKEARAAALKLLAVLAAIRLDEKSDRIENILSSALTDAPTAKGREITANTDPLASSSWEEISPKETLITPVQCKSIWRQFKTETEYTVSQAISAQEAHKRGNSWLPPPWAIAMIAILGFNEFMVLLKNPLYLGVTFVLFLVSRALWVQLGVAGEFRNGTMSGLISISTKLVPTIMNLLRGLAEAGQGSNGSGQQKVALSSESFRSETAESSSSNDGYVNKNGSTAL